MARQAHRETDFGEKTIAYAKAKTAYFDAIRAAMPEIEGIAIGDQKCLSACQDEQQHPASCREPNFH
jgi:hypothetical protein